MSDRDKRIRVVVVEDSVVIRELLVYLLSRDPSMEVVGTAGDGDTALEQVRAHRPDVITMDIHMPGMDGLEATRRIMETIPTPIVIVSISAARDEVAATFRALEAGALAIIDKPSGIGGDSARKFVETIKLMAGVKVVRRWPRLRQPIPEPPPADASLVAKDRKIVVIGASTGGPLVLQTILSGLPRDFPVPVVIVQHIAPGFTAGFAEWLGSSSHFPVQVAQNGDAPAPGQGYVAPDGLHLIVDNNPLAGPRMGLSGDAPENGHRPSVSRLFRSVAQSFGSAAVGVLLSGMGKDGAAELKMMRDRGAVTIAQSRESSVVPGMPGEAIDLHAAMHILEPEDIARVLREAVEIPATGSGKPARESRLPSPGRNA